MRRARAVPPVSVRTVVLVDAIDVGFEVSLDIDVSQPSMDNRTPR
jgi:hypothetical protein